MTHSGRLEGTVSLVISTKDKCVGPKRGPRGEALRHAGSKAQELGRSMIGLPPRP